MTVKSNSRPGQLNSQNSSDQPTDSVPVSVIDALYDLHRHRDVDTLPEKILAVVPRMIFADSAVWVRIQRETRSFTFSAWPAERFRSVNQKEAADLHLQDHPLVGHFSARRDARAWSPYDFVSLAAFQRTALYRRLYRPLGIEYQLAMLVPFPDRAPRILALNRRSSPFTQSDRSLLEMLWPHFVQAVKACRGAKRKLFLREVDMLSQARGIILLDGSGNVELCTEQARIWLTRYCLDGLPRREIRKLPEPIARWLALAFEDLTLHSRGIGDPHPPLTLRRGEHYLTLRLVADHGRGQHLVLMDEASLDAPPDFLTGQGLTPREAEVLSWVAQGKTNRETGVILGLSTRTVQKHLERIFTKLGVESRTGAILKAWQVGRYEELGARKQAFSKSLK